MPKNCRYCEADCNVEHVICPNCTESCVTIKAISNGFRFKCIECECYWFEEAGVSNAKRKPVIKPGSGLQE